MEIDVTDVTLVELAKAVYALSRPQGMGFMHFQEEPLTDEEAQGLIHQSADGTWLRMDYVHGRACKFTVWEHDGRLVINGPWADHTDQQLRELLQRVGVEPPEDLGGEHNPGCSCDSCKRRRLRAGLHLE